MPFFSNATAHTGVSAYHTASLYHTVAPVHTAYPSLHTTLYPVKEPHYTTVYETILPAACETSQWMATYTITETCVGKPTDYVTPTMPPGFVVTTVACHACKPATEIEITCPGAQPTGTWMPTVSITGNGVTATITAYPTSAPATSTRTVHTAVPTTTMVGACSGHGCSGSGSNPGAGSGPSGGMGSGSGCTGASCGSSGSGSSPATGNGGSGSAPGTGSSPSSGCTGPSCVSSGCNGSNGRCNGSGMASNGTTSSMPAVVTAGASSFKNAFAVFSGLVFVAGHFLIL